MSQPALPISVGRHGRRHLTLWDAVAVLLIVGLFAFLAEAGRGFVEPLAHLSAHSISLDPARLPDYAARTELRMQIGREHVCTPVTNANLACRLLIEKKTLAIKI